MGPDGAYHQNNREHIEHYYGANRIDHGYHNEQPAEGDGRYEGVHERCDWTDEPYHYYGQFAEDKGHDRGIHERGDNRGFEGRENDHKHGSDVFARTDCYKY